MATVAQTPVSNPLEVVEVLDFMRANKFTQVHNEVRVNTSGYPYITFIDKNNQAENIYFSKGASESVSEGQPIVKGFFNDFRIAEVKNADGENRIKLVRAGSSTRLDLADLF